MKRSRVGKAKAAGKGPQASEPLAGDEAQRLRAIIESAEGVHTLGGEELLRALKADRPCDSKSCKVGGGGAAAAGARMHLGQPFGWLGLGCAAAGCSVLQLPAVRNAPACRRRRTRGRPANRPQPTHPQPTQPPACSPLLTLLRRARRATPTACATWCRRRTATAKRGCGRGRCGPAAGETVRRMLRCAHSQTSSQLSGLQGNHNIDKCL